VRLHPGSMQEKSGFSMHDLTPLRTIKAHSMHI
jgi:hypothetical protein